MRSSIAAAVKSLNAGVTCICAAPTRRPSGPRAIRSLWRKAQAHYHRSEKGGGSWEFFTKLPDRWVMNYKNLRFYVRPTGFKHTGLFPEQAANWDWMTDLVAERVKQGERCAC